MRFKSLHIPLSLAAMFLVAGCASMLEGTSQEVFFDSDPSGADCTLQRNNQVIGSVRTPGSAFIKKTRSDIDVTCKKDGYQDAAAHLKSDFAAMTLGNAIFGGVPGIVIDVASGADNKYTDHTMLTLTPAKTAAVADPAPADRDVRLARLRELLDRGTISASDYQALRPDADGSAPFAKEADNVAAASGGDHDALLWNRVKDSRNPDDFRAYLAIFPNGTFASVVRDVTKPLPVVLATASGAADATQMAGFAGNWKGSGHGQCEWSGTLMVRDRLVTGAISIDHVDTPIKTTLRSDDSLDQILGGLANPTGPSRWEGGRFIEGHFPNLVFARGRGGPCGDVYMTFTKVAPLS